MNKPFFALIYVFFIVGAAAQSCSNPTPQTDLINSGKIEVTLGKVSLTKRGSGREHCFNIPAGYTLPADRTEIAISTSRINGYNPSSGFDFSISAGRISTTSIGINVQINEDSRWTSFDVVYLISSRTDLVLGSFVNTLFPVTSCASFVMPSVALDTYIPLSKLTLAQNYKAVAFISGVRSASSNFNLRISGADINKSDGRLTVQIQSSSSPGVELLFVSYIIYPETHSQFDFKIGNVIQQSYSLEGINNFVNNQNVQTNQWSICKRGSTVTCGLNERLVNNICECVQGYVKVNGICYITCATNSYVAPDRVCTCLPGFQRNSRGACVESTLPPIICRENEVLGSNNVCVCKTGYTRTSLNVCVISCGQNEIANGTICTCAPGYSRNQNGVCTLIPRCPTNEILSGNQCVCVTGYVRGTNGICAETIRCGPNEILSGNQCVCTQGYSRNLNGVCVINQRCPNNEVLQGSQCVCVQGYSRNSSGVCVITPRCSTNEILSGNQCICINGYVRAANGSCVEVTRCGANEINVGNVCQCTEGFERNSKGVCTKVIACGVMNEVFDIESGSCECRYGFIRVGPLCVERCGLNQEWKDEKCICISGTAYINFACRPCPSNAVSNSDRTNCICEGNRLLNTTSTTLTCGGCPNSSVLQNNQCTCTSGLVWNTERTSCVSSVCPPNSTLSNNACVCIANYYMDNNVCKPIPQCPSNSVWSSQKLQCECTIAGQYVLDGRCQACESNRTWNGSACVCVNGLFLINGRCQSCPLASTYNGTQCECNLGYFAAGNACQQCNPTCSKCTGESANQCTSCVDITFTLKDGYCTRNNTCPIGTYLNGSTCAKCSDYCQACGSEFECTQCAPGFQISLQIISNVGYTSCQSVCGDGKKVDFEQCDDANTRNGDGCNSKCEVESGWSCSGGTSAQSSTCINSIPTRSIITVKGAVTQVGKVVQGVRLSYIPKCFTDRECVDCYRILDVKVVEGSIPTDVKVSYMPNSEGQFLVEYLFGGFITSTVFKYQIQINKNLPANYVNCFNAEDYAQQLVGTVDSALLAKVDQASELSLEDIGSDVSGSTIAKIFS